MGKKFPAEPFQLAGQESQNETMLDRLQSQTGLDQDLDLGRLGQVGMLEQTRGRAELSQQVVQE